jgi:hypothetical protein
MAGTPALRPTAKRFSPILLQSNSVCQTRKRCFRAMMATDPSRRCIESYAGEMPTVRIEDLFSPNDNADRPH